MNSDGHNPAPGPGPAPGRSPALLILGAAAVLAVIVVAAVAAKYLRLSAAGVGQPIGQMDAGALAESLPSGRAPALPQPTGLGSLFKAQPSDRITPTIVMDNFSSDGDIHVVFSGPTNVTKVIPPGGSVEFQLPQGSYHVRAWHDTTAAREGTAVFRQHTRYSCGWLVTDTAPEGPLRIGDIE